MKQVIYFLVTLVFLTGCSKYDYTLSDAGLTVKESVLEFTAKGGDGYILVESKNPIEATSNSDWCRIKVTDKKIEVTVESHLGIENRTAVVSISADRDYAVNVPVTQSASRFIINAFHFEVGNEATTVKTAAHSQQGIIFTTEETWMTADYDGDSISIAVSKNPGKERKGTIKVTSGTVSQTITVMQESAPLSYDDFIGSWTLSFFNTIEKETTRRSMTVTMSKNEYEASYLLGAFPNVLNEPTGSTNLVLSYSVKNGKNIFRFANCQSLSDYEQDRVIACVWDVKRSFTTDPNVTYGGEFIYENNKITIQFKNNGSWANNQTNGLMVGTFGNDGAYQGSLYSMDYIIMTKN